MTADPLLLAVETATAAPSVALWRGDALLGERAADPGRPTAEALLPALDALLADAGLALAAVEAVAVSIGPGSFTGLRIGVATVKGLAFGTGRPAIAVSTLAAVARAGSAARSSSSSSPRQSARLGAAVAVSTASSSGAPGSLTPSTTSPRDARSGAADRGRSRTRDRSAAAAR